MSKRNGRYIHTATVSSDDLRDRASAYLVQPNRDTTAKCAAPPCDTRVAYAGDFCRDCLRVQREMRERLRAKRT